MKKSAVIFVSDGIEEIETSVVFDLLVRANIYTEMISVNINNNLLIKGAHGMQFLTDSIISEKIKEKNFDAVVLPGGIKGVKIFQKNSILSEYISYIFSMKKIIAAICAAPIFLFQNHSDLFKNAKITSFPKLKNYFFSKNWLDERVIYDKNHNLITSQGPGTSIEFSLKIIELLYNRDFAVNIAKQLILANSDYLP